MSGQEQHPSPEVTYGWEQELGEKAEGYYRQILSAGEGLIRARLFLGGVVHEALERGRHGDGVVRRLAQRMSTAMKKRIAVSKLYDAAQLYAAFHGDFAKVEQLRDRLAFPLT